VATTTLAAGQAVVLDAADTACTRLAAAGAEGAEYLYVAVATVGRENKTGVSAPYDLTANVPGPTPVASRRSLAPRLSRPLDQAQQFHQRIRALERELSETPPPELPRPGAAAVQQAPPVLGEERTFNVLKSNTVSGKSAGDYVQVTGTVKYLGTHVAIFLDNAAPTGGYTQPDLDKIGSMFDTHLYPIDITAFGHESDIDNNHLVLVLLTDRVTRLTSCTGGSIIVGFFWPFDLVPSSTSSNAAEIFYGLTPDPSCGISLAQANDLLPGVFIHEFQHMISFNHHFLVGRARGEDTWLNEGLSMFAQELGGRQVPDSLCTNNSCRTQFILDDLDNAYSYLSDVEGNFLIGPNSPPIPLTEYGAAWLFVRWLSDHFAQDTLLGTDLTQRLDNTTLFGSANVSSATGVPFSTLVAEWQMANYLDDLPGFDPGPSRLRYRTWNFRSIFASFHQQDPFDFPSAYPLEPDSAADSSYARTGVLRAGSGRHVLLVQQPATGTVDLRLTAPDNMTAVADSVAPRIGLVRIR
jgi:hypothetical protein